MPQATVWDLEGWGSPITVAGLNPERERGYFALCLVENYRAVVFDAAGRLYVKADLILHPSPSCAHRDWLCEVQYVPGGGIALRLAKQSYEYVYLEKGKLSGYLPVSEVF